MIARLFTRFFFTKKTSWMERHFLKILIVGSLIAALISLMIGLQQSVWYDEAYSILLAKQPLAELLHLTSIDTHPPLYYLLLKAWATLFGWGELALRSLSVFALGGSIFVGGLLVRRLFNARIALLTLPFIIFAPFILRYGFEIRMYALASLVGIAATYVLILALEAKRRQTQWWLYGAYAALIVTGVYLLYYLALLWIAHALWLVWKSVSEKKPIASWRWMVAFISAALLFLPWMPTFLSQVNNGALSPVVKQLTLDQLSSIVTFNFLYQPSWQLGVISSMLAVYVISAVTYFAVKAFKNVSRKQRQYLVLLAMYLVVPILLLMLVSLRKPMYVERYLAHVVIGGLLFVGVTVGIVITKKASRQVWLAGGVLVVILLMGTVHLIQTGNYNFQRLELPATKQAAALAESSCDNRSAVIAKDPYIAIELSYYLPDCQIYFYSETAELTGGYAPLSNSPFRLTNPVSAVGAAERAYYIYDGDSNLQFSDRFHQLSEQTFDSLHVREFSVE
jgi:uncharacterized membrane protein